MPPRTAKHTHTHTEKERDTYTHTRTAVFGSLKISAIRFSCPMASCQHPQYLERREVHSEPRASAQCHQRERKKKTAWARAGDRGFSMGFRQHCCLRWKSWSTRHISFTIRIWPSFNKCRYVVMSVKLNSSHAIHTNHCFINHSEAKRCTAQRWHTVR